MVDIASIRQLFLDDYIVDSLDGVIRRYHRPIRSIDKPVLGATAPWEINSIGPFLFGGTVIYDEEDHIFKMWYRLDEPLEKAPEGMREVVAEDGSITRRNWIEHAGLFKAAYATSTDGINWDRPILGVTEYQGSKINNILPSGTGGKSIIRRPAIIKDYLEADPARKYKMAYVDNVNGKWSLEKAYSPNGINWEMGVGDPAYFKSPVVPHGALFGWDPRKELWVHYSKKIGKRLIDVDGSEISGLQAICRSTSKDFEHWGNTREIITANPFDPQMWSAGSHAILSAISYTDDLYIGLSDTVPARSAEDVQPSLIDTVGSMRQEHFTELFYSRDGINWNRTAPFFEFLKPGVWGTWDSELVLCSKPIVKDDQILFYYTGNNLQCNAHIPDHPQRDLIGTVSGGVRSGYGIGVASMRLDGFVSIDGDYPGGVLTTKPLVFNGDRLILNARVPEGPDSNLSDTVPDFGVLRVEITDKLGNTLPGYGDSDSDPVLGDSIEHVVSWNGKSDIGRLEGIPVRLRFHLKNSALYSFHTRSQKVVETSFSTTEPGSRGRPS